MGNEGYLGQNSKNILTYKKYFFKVVSNKKWRIPRTDLNPGQNSIFFGILLFLVFVLASAISYYYDDISFSRYHEEAFSVTIAGTSI